MANHRQSTASDMTLQELEPSPVESPNSPDLEKGPNEYFPPSSSTSFLGLREPSHTGLYYLTRIHKYSTYPPSAFLLMHITNTSIIPLFTRSVADSETFLLLTRPYYQSFPIEPLLLFAPVLVHVISGLALRIARRRQMVSNYGAESRSERRQVPWPKLSWSSVSGYLLSPLIAGHVVVNRLTPLYVEGGSSSVGLSYVAHGFAKHPLVANAGYAVFVSLAAGHVIWGWARWMGWVVPKQGMGDLQKRRTVRKWIINAVAASVAALWMAGGLGVVGRGGTGRGWQAKEWNGLYRSVPLIGAWL